MFFHHPDCGGCKKTISETLIDSKVQKLMEIEFIPLRYMVTENDELAKRYKIEWTSAFIVADNNGEELERWVGFLPPEDFIAQLELSEGLADFHAEKYSEADRCFEKVINEHQKAEVTPEAYYYLGVSRYKESGDASYLQKTWEIMRSNFPHNSWTKRASAWA